MKGLGKKGLQEDNKTLFAIFPTHEGYLPKFVLSRLLITDLYPFPTFSSHCLYYFLQCCLEGFSWRVSLQTPLHILSLFSLFQIKCPSTGFHD